jgi:osmotically-inducible protein OsmY
MYMNLSKLALTSAIALALATASGAALAGDKCDEAKAGNTSNDVTGARQESQILTTYALSPYLRAGDLEVSVEGGTATLTGTVAEDVDSALAKQIALGVTGIDNVDNQIDVQADYTPSAAKSADRSFGEVVDDATITTTVKSKLLWGKSTEGLQMDVDTQRGKVTLSGEAETVAAKELAGRIAQNTDGVESVDNRLVVNVSTSKPTSERMDADTGKDLSEAVADSWITTKVKSTFMYSNNVESNDISASTDNGIVTLSGTVDSGADKEMAVELAQNVRGVKSVDAKALTF